MDLILTTRVKINIQNINKIEIYLFLFLIVSKIFLIFLYIIN